MDKFWDLSLWIEVGAIVAIGAVLLLAASRAVQLLASRARLAPLTVRPIRFVLRWAGILVIVGLLANKLFDVDLMARDVLSDQDCTMLVTRIPTSATRPLKSLKLTFALG